MEGPIQRVELPRIPPLSGPDRSRERKGRSGKPFALGVDMDTEADAEAERESGAPASDHDRRVGPAPPDEAGARVDVTA